MTISKLYFDIVSDTLAGRTTIFRLLPLSLAELTDAGHDRTSDAMLLGGFYPRPLVEKIEPVSFYQDYITTYLERDLRQLSEVRNLSSFRRFLALCAGRVGQILDLQALGNDVGISQPTARAWMSLLEASYIVFLLPPYFANIGKRLVKRPKLYFYDVGVAAHLLGMSSLNHVTTHPLRGNLFENLVIMEWIKQRWNKHLPHNAYFYRDQSRNEIDLVVTDGDRIHLVEVKAGQTITEDYFRGIRAARKTRLSIDKAFVIYDGSERQTRSEAEVLPLRELPRLNLDAD